MKQMDIYFCSILNPELFYASTQIKPTISDVVLKLNFPNSYIRIYKFTNANNFT